MPLLLNVIVLSLVWMFVQCIDQNHHIFLSISDGKVQTLVLVSRKDDITSTKCKVVTNSDLINEIMNLADVRIVRPLSKNNMTNLLEVCGKLNSKRMEGNAVEAIRHENDMQLEREALTYFGYSAIYPGTKWCGAGDLAKNYNDLGEHDETDRCCRAHDFCNDTIISGETKNNLTNESDFTKLSCDCDNQFYRCLESVNSYTSNTIGLMYFNVLGNACYAIDYPEECTKYLWFTSKCLRYEKNTSKGKSYQWIRAKSYRKIPFPKF